MSANLRSSTLAACAASSMPVSLFLDMAGSMTLSSVLFDRTVRPSPQATADHNPLKLNGVGGRMVTRLRAARRGVRTVLPPCRSVRTGVNEPFVTFPCHTSDHRASSNCCSPHAGNMISPVSGFTCTSACCCQMVLTAAESC